MTKETFNLKKYSKKNLEKVDDDKLTFMQEEVISFLTKNKGYDQEFCDAIPLLLEIERELTLREEDPR